MLVLLFYNEINSSGTDVSTFKLECFYLLVVQYVFRIVKSLNSDTVIYN